MSRAFVSEEAREASASLPPERPVSTAPNLVTRRGLRLIECEVARLLDLLAQTTPDSHDRPRIARDLRYWKARQASARLVEPATGNPDEVAFGTRVTIVRDGSTKSYQLVGEDEADPAQGPAELDLAACNGTARQSCRRGRRDRQQCQAVTIQRIERG
jgi:transcription elongation GreA/GreB family factor